VNDTSQPLTIPGQSDNALPGDSGVWFFIFADMCAFAVFFLLFAAGRIAQPELYEASRLKLELGLGLASTLILLTSGAFMAQAVRRARGLDWEAARRSLSLSLAIGLLFAVSKWFEWSGKVAHGIGLTTNEFFTYYFVFTGIHFLHFAVGVAVLLVLIARCRQSLAQDSKLRWIEAGGAYWHMVDLLWIVLFAMLYLLPVWVVWAVLAGASLIGFMLAEGFAPAKIAATAAILLAAVKIDLVFAQYMELRWHHQPLRIMLTVWLAVITATLLAGYWAA
jgi:nitric oxide reductase NorE protein